MSLSSSWMSQVAFRAFVFTETATTEIYTLSLHDALPIWPCWGMRRGCRAPRPDRSPAPWAARVDPAACTPPYRHSRSEEHTSELQSLRHLVCRLLLEKKNKKNKVISDSHTPDLHLNQLHI